MGEGDDNIQSMLVFVIDGEHFNCHTEVARDEHMFLFMGDMDWAIIPAVATGQFRVWSRGPIPVGYASWALVSEEVDQRIGETQNSKLRPAEWKSSDIIWLMDVLAPFGGAEQMLQELRTQTLKGKKIKTLQPAPDGNGMAVVEW